MGCISSKKEFDDKYQNIFQVMNVDDLGNNVSSGQLEITDYDLVFYQNGKSPIKWPLRTLRRYGFDSELFSFESGRRCQTGPGIYAFQCRRAEQLFNLLQNRIQSQNNGDSEITDSTSNLRNPSSNRDSMYLEPAPLRRSNPGSRFSSQNGTTRLSSVGSTSGSVGPLSPQSITSVALPLDTVPLIPPLPISRPLSQNLYANEDIIAAVTQDLEEANNNNNKTVQEPFSPTLEHSYLNSGALDSLPNDVPTIVNHNILPEEISGSSVDNSHLYMNIIPGTDKVAPCFPAATNQSPKTIVTPNWEKYESSVPNYANFEAEESLLRKIPNAAVPVTSTVKSLNYLVLDLEPSGVPPKSPTTSLPPDISRKLSGGYVAIDFKKTAALSHSVNPNFDTDSDSSRKTRHSSNINNFSHKRHSSSVSD